MMTMTPREVNDKNTQTGYLITLPYFRSRPVPQIPPNTVLGDTGLPESENGALRAEENVQRKLYRLVGRSERLCMSASTGPAGTEEETEREMQDSLPPFLYLQPRGGIHPTSASQGSMPRGV